MNELELLKEHFAEVPDPTPEFMSQVQGRLADAMVDEKSNPSPKASKAWFHRPIVKIASIAASLLLVAVAVAVYSVAGNGGGPAKEMDGAWRLAGYVATPSGTENSNGPTSGFLTCPAPSTCYDASPQISQMGNSYVIGKSVLFLTTDDGASWAARALPTGVTLTTRLQCANVNSCSLGANGPGQSGFNAPQILTTSNGGVSWAAHDLPPGIGSLYALSCHSSTVCAGLASEDRRAHLGGTFIETDNGGTTWLQHAFPADQVETAVSCSDASNCLVIGDEPSATPGVAGYGVSAISNDEGKTWSSSTIRSIDFGQGVLACPNANFCMSMAGVPQEVTECPPSPSPAGTGTTVPCVTGQDDRTEPTVTTDGGRTWKLESFPTSVPTPMIFDVSCPTATLCWAAGADQVASQSEIGGITSGSADSPVVLMSQDGGASWKVHTFVTPKILPAGETLSGIGQVQCQANFSCVALGIDNAGSAHTLVYTFTN